ncbi:MAG: hypothetical protein K2G30_06555, partial [Muribaculaceae bacterium]|nr:hypothetical protein [Muribaculaceae bacterium]
GWVARGDDGTLEYVVMDNALRCVFYDLLNGSEFGYDLCSAMMLDFTYDPATDYENPENWKHAGTAAITENIVGQLFGAGENTAECEVYTCSFEEGLYRLDTPLAGMPFAAHGGEFVHGPEQTLYIHAADPGKVYLTISPEEPMSDAWWGLQTGWAGASGSETLCMVANAVSTGALNYDWIAEDYLGTFDREKGVFVLDNCFYHYFPSDGRVNKPENPRFRVVLGGSSGIDEAATAGAAVVSVEYYSVDGRRLAAPSDGLSIRLTRYTDGRVVTDKVVF